jgi:hypothetical protein
MDPPHELIQRTTYGTESPGLPVTGPIGEGRDVAGVTPEPTHASE